MSGDVTLVDTGDGAVRRLVSTAAELFARPGFAPAALVGGLAVTMRLATAHRATKDVDAVTDGDGPRRVALEYVGARGPGVSNRIEIDGVAVDVMTTEPLPVNADDLPDADLDRLFVLGHRWALTSAEPMTIRVVSPAGSAELQPSRLMVATAAALIACKFHALADRRDASSGKRESDALDLIGLIRELVRVPAALELFSPAPFDLVDLVVTQVQRWFVAGATRTARFANLAAMAGDARLQPEDISTLGNIFISELTGR